MRRAMRTSWRKARIPPDRFAEIFQEISTINVEDDGLRFDPKTVKAERIKEDADYGGVRVTFTAFLERAQIPIQIDIGFGDEIKPGPVFSLQEIFVPRG